jgi:hypothetical protein
MILDKSKEDKLRKAGESLLKDVTGVLRNSAVSDSDNFAAEIQFFVNLADLAVRKLKDPREALRDIDHAIVILQETGKIKEKNEVRAELLKLTGAFLVNGLKIIVGMI